jgi:hypothetical protein
MRWNCRPVGYAGEEYFGVRGSVFALVLLFLRERKKTRKGQANDANETTHQMRSEHIIPSLESKFEYKKK